jgi:enoyl-CoA hydratase/carnithine racemase
MITKEIKKETGIVTLSRPEKRNALNLEMVGMLLEALDEMRKDEHVKCIVIGAAGAAFCAGADIKELDRGGRKGINMYADVIESILSSPKPVIARVQGPVVAGGVGLVAACHLAAASDKAYFTTPEVQSDLFPLMVFMLISDKAGRKPAFEMALCGKNLSAAEAAAAGLVNAAVAPDRLDETVNAWTGTICKWDPSVVSKGLGVIHETKNPSLVAEIRACQKAIDVLDARRSLTREPGRP